MKHAEYVLLFEKKAFVFASCYNYQTTYFNEEKSSDLIFEFDDLRYVCTFPV